MLRLPHRPRWLSWLVLYAVTGVGHSQTVTSAPKQADAIYRAGQLALAQRDLAAARSDFEQVVRLAPEMEQGHSALGAVLLSLGQVQAAIHELQAALAIGNTDIVAETNLAMAYQTTGQPAKAIPLFASLDATARSQGHRLPATALAAYARALAATGKAHEALAPMRSAVAAESEDGGLHDDLGSLYAQQHNWPAAQGEFLKAIEVSPALATAHLHLGLALEAQHQDGRSELTQAAQLAPANPLIAMELGRAYATAGQDQQAILQFKQVLANDPNSAEAMLEMAPALQRLDQLEDALTVLRKVVAMQPKNATALANLGMALVQAQQSKEAVEVLQRAVALAPGDAAAHEDLAAAYIQLNQLGDTVAQLQAALKLAPDSPRSHYELGLALRMQDKAGAAIPELEAAQKLDPGSPEAPYTLGLLYMQAGRYDEAATELKTSLYVQPKNGEGWAMLGSIYNSLNMLPEATSALREATKQLPNQPDAHLTLASVLMKNNQPAQATLERKKAADLMRINTNQQRARTATNAGNGLLKSSDLAAAAERYRDALGYDANFAEAHLGLANVLDAQGKSLEAAEERKRAQTATKAETP